MKLKDLEEHILSMPNTWLDFPFGEDVKVYKIGHNDSDTKDSGKMFALIPKGDPLRISLKCDPQLAELLRAKYESIQPGYHLNKKHWNTIVCTGQVEDDELKDLIRHSYELVNA